MNWLAALFVMLTLAACTQGSRVTYASYPLQNVHDRGGDGWRGWRRHGVAGRGQSVSPDRRIEARSAMAPDRRQVPRLP
jgi:hypothetical protein